MNRPPTFRRCPACGVIRPAAEFRSVRASDVPHRPMQLMLPAAPRKVRQKP
jgi:hypothetical protein